MLYVMSPAATFIGGPLVFCYSSMGTDFVISTGNTMHVPSIWEP